LRSPLVTALVMATHYDPLRRQRLTSAVRSWAGGSHFRRTVKEAILIRTLLPEWHRWRLILWIRIRTIFTAGI
jgi:hypothetical protein